MAHDGQADAAASVGVRFSTATYIAHQATPREGPKIDKPPERLSERGGGGMNVGRVFRRASSLLHSYLPLYLLAVLPRR